MLSRVEENFSSCFVLAEVNRLDKFAFLKVKFQEALEEEAVLTSL